jgi:hypothetical protein
MEPVLCVEAVGADPGSAHFGIACARFLGMLDLVDEGTGQVTETTVKLELLAMEHWSLKTGVITRMGEDGEKSVAYVETKPTPQHSEDMIEWARSMSEMVAASRWIFTEHHSMLDGGASRLPILVVENQFDHIKNNYAKTEMREVMNITFTSVLAGDATRAQLSDRVAGRCCFRAMDKHGQRCDKSRERVDRKIQAVVDTKQLLRQQGTENARKWLTWLEYVERQRDGQIHDMCDALLLIVARFKKLYGEMVRSEIRERRALLKKIPVAPVRRSTKPMVVVDKRGEKKKEGRKRKRGEESETKAERKKKPKLSFTTVNLCDDSQ